MRVSCIHTYKDITSLENLLEAWKEFRVGKKHRKDILEFERNLMRNIIELQGDLERKIYRHSPYEAFGISDPKPRSIHKATVRDRLLHHAIYRKLYQFFDRIFISDSYSCRVDKGTHKAIERFKRFSAQVSKNHTRTAWVLKCDVRKFFASIDQSTLMNIIKKYVVDEESLQLVRQIISSFYSTQADKGLPLGNLTSQLFVNVYMNEFDQFVKHRLKAKYYIRYADDFVILSEDRSQLEGILPLIVDFLSTNLHLELHPDKVSIESVVSGVDFLGWVHFKDYRVLRTTTKNRMFRGIRRKEGKDESVQSYLGLLSHGNSKKIVQKVLKMPEVASKRYTL